MRAGIVIAGRCVMAPSALDLRQYQQSIFGGFAKNGITVTIDGVAPPVVVAWDEDEGWVDCLTADLKGRPHIEAKQFRLEGKVVALPGKDR